MFSGGLWRGWSWEALRGDKIRSDFKVKIKILRQGKLPREAFPGARNST